MIPFNNLAHIEALYILQNDKHVSMIHGSVINRHTEYKLLLQQLKFYLFNYDENDFLKHYPIYYGSSILNKQLKRGMNPTYQETAEFYLKEYKQ